MPPKVSKTEAKARRHVYSSGLQGCGGGSSEVWEPSVDVYVLFLSDLRTQLDWTFFVPF